MNFSKAIGPILIAGLLAGGMVGCDQEGPAEEAGEEVDEAVEEAGEEMENAGEELQDKTE